MPGQTNNTTILAADNQLIITQNEQTTELNDIEAAILSLKAVIASTGGGSGSGGSNDGSTGIQDMIGVDPLEDFTPEQGSSRCTIANFIFDGIYQCADELGDGPLQGLTSLAAAITTGIPSFVLGVTVFASSPVILVAAGSVLLGAIAAYIAYSGDFSTIADELAEQKQAIINDLYRAKNLYEAKAAFADNCSEMSSPNKFLLGLLCHTDIIKVLFISNFAVPAGYSPTESCQDISELGNWKTFDGSYVNFISNTVEYTYTSVTLEASTGTVFGGGGWADRYYLAGTNQNPDNSIRKFTIICEDSSYTLSGAPAGNPNFYQSANLENIIPQYTIVEAGKVYIVSGCNSFRIDTVQGSAGLSMKIEVAE